MYYEKSVKFCLTKKFFFIFQKYFCKTYSYLSRSFLVHLIPCCLQSYMYLHTENGCIHEQEFCAEKSKVFLKTCTDHHICHLQKPKLKASHLYGNNCNSPTPVDQDLNEQRHYLKNNLLSCRRIRSPPSFYLVHSKLAKKFKNGHA